LAYKSTTPKTCLHRRGVFKFFLNDGKLSAEDAMQSHTIASVQNSVENPIKKLKEYKLFTETLCNRTNNQIVDDMMIIVCGLCNLKEKLIK